MIQRLLDPHFLLLALVGLAIATPVLAFVLYRANVRNFSRRIAIVFGAIGPFALAYWHFHQLILARVGFDSMYSALIVMGVAIVAGSVAGLWAGMENRGARSTRVSAPAADQERPGSPPPQG